MPAEYNPMRPISHPPTGIAPWPPAGWQPRIPPPAQAGPVNHVGFGRFVRGDWPRGLARCGGGIRFSGAVAEQAAFFSPREGLIRPEGSGGEEVAGR